MSKTAITHKYLKWLKSSLSIASRKDRRALKIGISEAEEILEEREENQKKKKEEEKIVEDEEDEENDGNNEISEETPKIQESERIRKKKNKNKRKRNKMKKKRKSDFVRLLKRFIYFLINFTLLIPEHRRKRSLCYALAKVYKHLGTEYIYNGLIELKEHNTMIRYMKEFITFMLDQQNQIDVFIQKAGFTTQQELDFRKSAVITKEGTEFLDN